MGGGNGAKEASCHTCKQAAVTETGIESICYKTAQLTGPPMQSLQRREQQGQHGTVLAGVKLLRKITVDLTVLRGNAAPSCQVRIDHDLPIRIKKKCMYTGIRLNQYF